MYDIPSQENVEKCIITKDTVEKMVRLIRKNNINIGKAERAKKALFYFSFRIKYLTT